MFPGRQVEFTNVPQDEVLEMPRVFDRQPKLAIFDGELQDNSCGTAAPIVFAPIAD